MPDTTLLPGTEEDPRKRKRLQNLLFNAADPVSGTAQYLMALSQLPKAAADPEPVTVSGSDVVGLAPEQADRLLSRVQQQSQFEAQMARDQNRSRERAIEGLNTHVFRARELEAARKQKQADDLQRRREGNVVGSRTTGYDRIYEDGAGNYQVQPIQAGQPRQMQPRYVTVPGEGGKPTMRLATPEELVSGVQLYEKPANPPNMQVRDYSVFQGGQNVRMRDIIDPTNGSTVRTENLGPGYNSGAGSGAMTPYQRESLRQRALGTADKLVEKLGDSGGVDPHVRQVIGDTLHNAGYDDAFINAYLDERVTVDNSWIPGSHGQQAPYTTPQQPGQQQPAPQVQQPGAAPGQDIVYDGKPAWLLPDGRVMLK